MACLRPLWVKMANGMPSMVGAVGEDAHQAGVDGPKTKQAGIMHAMCPAGDALRSRVHIIVNNGEWRTAEIVIIISAIRSCRAPFACTALTGLIGLM